MSVERLRSESDEVLMVRVQRNEVAAFEELFDRHARRALGVARSVCFDTGRAEDAVQEGFLSIWRARGHYRPESGTFKAWAMSVVRHRAIDLVRTAASRPQLVESQMEQPDPAADSPTEEILASEEATALRASLAQLPEEQSEVIGLAFFGELSHSEIASQLELPLGTVKGRMRLGLERLRVHVAEPEKSTEPLGSMPGASRGSQNDGPGGGAAVRREERLRGKTENASPGFPTRLRGN